MYFYTFTFQHFFFRKKLVTLLQHGQLPLLILATMQPADEKVVSRLLLFSIMSLWSFLVVNQRVQYLLFGLLLNVLHLHVLRMTISFKPHQTIIEVILDSYPFAWLEFQVVQPSTLFLSNILFVGCCKISYLFD